MKATPRIPRLSLTRIPSLSLSLTRILNLSLSLILSLPLLLPPRPAQAGGFSSIDFGTRRMGSFSVVARPDDVTAIFHNPAGLTLQSGTNLFFYASVIVGELAMQFYDSKGVLRPDHVVTPDFNVGALPFLGVATDLGTRRFRLGFGLYAPNSLGAAMPEDEPTRYHATKALFIASRATLAAAWEVSDAFSLGASVSLVHTFIRASRVMNPMVLSDPDQRFRPVSETAPYDYDLTISGQGLTWGWDLGLLWRPTPSLRLGASFSSGSAVTMKGPVTLVGPDGRTQESTHTTTMVLPFTLKAGVNWQFVDDFEIAADVVWWHYQVFQEQRSVLSTPLLGIAEFRDPKRFGNSVLWNVGLTYHIRRDIELMMGFQMDFSPTPTATYAIESPARDSQGVAAGFRWQATDRLRVGAALNRIWFDLTDIQDSRTTPPTNAKGYGGMVYFGADVSYRL